VDQLTFGYETCLDKKIRNKIKVEYEDCG
jgi:hypothetical protein